VNDDEDDVMEDEDETNPSVHSKRTRSPVKSGQRKLKKQKKKQSSREYPCINHQ
jgi:hypothetical protein